MRPGRGLAGAEWPRERFLSAQAGARGLEDPRGSWDQRTWKQILEGIPALLRIPMDLLLAHRRSPSRVRGAPSTQAGWQAAQAGGAQ